MGTTYDMRLKTVFRMIIAAPAGSGKTTFCKYFLSCRNEIMDIPPVRVIYYYKLWQPMFDEMIAEALVDEFVQGPPTMQDLQELSVYKNDGGVLAILDDLIQSVGPELAEAFQVGSRHNGVNLVFLTQNLFPKDKHFRDISLNASYCVLLKNPRDSSSITHFARQFNPGQTKYVTDVYKHATMEPYSYLFIDLHQSTPEKLRLRSHIFPHQHPMKVYVPK